jgi:hypothetical protein
MEKVRNWRDCENSIGGHVKWRDPPRQRLADDSRWRAVRRDIANEDFGSAFAVVKDIEAIAVVDIVQRM